MAEYRCSVTLDGALTDEQIGALMDALVPHGGAVAVENQSRSILVWSIEAEVPTGWAPGLVQAIPLLIGTGASIVEVAGLLDTPVIGLSVERVVDPIPSQEGLVPPPVEGE